jgi:hypothetical protein
MSQYEASAPNASAVARGDVLSSQSPRVVSRAGSIPGVLPWTNVTPVDAASACSRIGATLCTEGQWQATCEARSVAAPPPPAACIFGYETACSTYVTNRCNGLEFDFVAGGNDDDGLLVTHSPRVPTCDANWNPSSSVLIYDMSGNAREITSVRTGLTDAYPLRGGSYTSPQSGLRCDSDWTLVDGTFFYPNTGFRCCFAGTTPP